MTTRDSLVSAEKESHSSLHKYELQFFVSVSLID